MCYSLMFRVVVLATLFLSVGSTSGLEDHGVDFDEGQSVLHNFAVHFEPNEFHPEGKEVQVILTKNDLPHWSKLVHRICVEQYMIAFYCVQLRDVVEEVCNHCEILL